MHPRPPARKAPAASPIELTVEKLVPGGEGLARHEGKVVFIPGALPGEKVRVRLTEAKKDYARAEVEAVLSPSASRVEPPCPVAGRCGGCDWQHLDYPEQLRQKAAMAKDALRRLGGIDWPDLPIEAGAPWRYRSRAQFHVDPAHPSRFGYLARGSHAVVPVTACPIADPALEALLAAGPGGPREGRQPRRYMAWGHAGASALAPMADPASKDRGTAEEDTSAASGSAPGLVASILGKPIRFDLRCFFQSNPAMLEKLIPHALEGLSGNLAMDLYCGVGLFGAFLADRFRKVLAVESNPASLAFARRNIPGTEHAFLEGRLEDLVLQGRLGEEVPEAVVVDPPRAGLDEAVREWLAETRPSRLVYVSCNPVTLARDLKSLTAAGYRIGDIKLFDFYPQTAHMEAVARLSQ